MKLYLISNNLVLENIIYQNELELEQKRINRPLSIKGENLAKKLTNILTDVQAIYTSDYASAIGSSKYLAAACNLPVNIDSHLRDSKIGNLGRHNIKMLRFMQERELEYKFPGGESLNDTKGRMKRVIKKIKETEKGNIAIFTHKRAILSYLLDYTEHGFNLDDRLILSYQDNVILDDADKDADVIVMEMDNGNILNIEALDIEG